MSAKEICLDRISVERIAKLHPRLRGEALAILTEASKALTGRAQVRFTYTLRTMSEQQALYNQGRTVRGPVVTKAKPGQSYHNYGLAVDIALIIDGKTASWDSLKDFDGDRVADWMEVVAIFKRWGWFWGGDFSTFSDKPHFEKRVFNGVTYHWKELLALHNSGNIDREGYVII